MKTLTADQIRSAPNAIEVALEMLDREILDFLFEQRKYGRDHLYLHTRFITGALGYPREHIRAAMKGLRQRGLIEYRRGLFGDDGLPAGAGHRISDAGIAHLEREL